MRAHFFGDPRSIVLNDNRGHFTFDERGNVNLTLLTHGVQRVIEDIQKYLVDPATLAGPGITEEVRAHIFEPFYTTKEIGKGTGLGLSISYGIVQDHGGDIQVMSETGKGTEFIIHIPVHRD